MRRNRVVAAEAELTKRVRQWIARGGRPPAEPSVLIDCADKLLRSELSRSAKKALILARQLLSRAERLRWRDMAYVALRGVARAAHTGGDHRLARSSYVKARTIAVIMADRRGQAQIDRALADVHMYLNRYADAQAYARRAIKIFRALKSDADVVQTEVNLANLLHRQDRHRDAENLYRKAEAFFAQSDNPVAMARVAYNLGNTQVQLCSWEEASASYGRALEIYTEQKFDLDANDARYGLAYLELLSDRFATALGMLGECERKYREGGDLRGAALCVLDLTEAYLGLNLYAEARTSAKDALGRFGKLKLRYETAKATLFLAWACAGLQDYTEARRDAHKALRLFTAEENRGMAAAAQLLIAQLTRGDAPRRAALTEARRLFGRAQLPIWSMLCDLQILAGPDGRAAQRRLEGNRALRRVPHWSALYDSLRGDMELRKGRTSPARRHLQRAVATLEQARAGLPPLELRSAYLAGRTDPYSRLVALEAGRNPKAAVQWAERLKTAGLWTPSRTWTTLNPEAERLQAEWDALARQLSVTSRKLEIGRGSSRAAAAREDERRMRLLEARSGKILSRLEALRLEKCREKRSIEQLIEVVSARLPVVLWHAGEAELYAFVLRGNEVHAHVWPDGQARLALDLRRWRFLVERHMLEADAAVPSAAFDAERTFWAELGEWLWKPLDLGVGAGTDVLLIPTGQLFAVPFAALCVDDQWLGDRHRFTVAPSLRHYDAASRVTVASEAVEIFEAPDLGLPAVQSEVEALVGHLDRRNYTLHRPALRESLLNAPDARLWHFAGHARFRADNPFYSALQLADGPVFAADLRTRRVPVRLATLSACHSGGGATAPGEEFSGFVRSIMEMGARSVLAGLWPVADASTAFWMARFYGSWLAEGTSLSEAVRVAQAETRSRWSSPYHWAAFALFGAES